MRVCPGADGGFRGALPTPKWGAGDAPRIFRGLPPNQQRPAGDQQKKREQPLQRLPAELAGKKRARRAPRKGGQKKRQRMGKGKTPLQAVNEALTAPDIGRITQSVGGENILRRVLREETAEGENRRDPAAAAEKSSRSVL